MKRTLLLSLLLAALPRPSLAALTDSEKAVVRTFIDKGVADTAPRVRALVGRPDLSPTEIALALRPGLSEAPFDDKHRRFVDALIFGQGSAASRNTLVPAVVDGLLARASADYNDVPLDPAARVDARVRKAAEEALEIHAYIDRKIANAGTPSADGHDLGAGIRDDALNAAALLYKDHIASHEAGLKAPSRLSSEMLRLRVQAGLTLIDLGRGIVARHELAEWLGLTGERRAVFERAGVLVECDGASEGRIATAIGMLESAKDADEGLSGWIVSKASPVGLRARGPVVRAGVELGETAHPIDGATLWPDEVKPSSPDAALVGVAGSAADLATYRALSTAPVLRERARAAAEHAANAGPLGYLAPSATRIPLPGAQGMPAPAPSPELALSGAVQLLLLDGLRAIEVAVIRSGEGRPEPLEQLALALTVLSSSGGSFGLGVTRDGGRVDSVPASDVKIVDGLVNSFALSGRRFTVVADPKGIFTVRVDGKIPRLTELPDFHERTQPGTAFRADGIDYDRLFGEPRAAGLDDGRLVLEGSKAGFDAVVTGPEGSDQEVAAVIRPGGSGGGLLARGQPGAASYEGVGILLEADASRARLLRFDGHAKAVQLAEPIPLPTMPAKGYVVSLKVEGDAVTAKIDGRVLTGRLTRELEPGRVGLAVRADGRLDVWHLVAKTKALNEGPATPKGSPLAPKRSPAVRK